MNKSLRQPAPEKVLSCILSLMLALVYGLFLYSSVTPLGPCYSSDNSIYMIMGTALSHGYRPYLDIFDHKGPFLFLLQWLPQSIGDGFLTITVFFQEVLFLFLNLCIIKKISRQFFSCHEIVPQLLYLAYTSSLVGEGNLSEEYTNLFTLLSCYCLLAFFLSSTDNLCHAAKRYSFIVGFCFSLSFLTRANNSLPILFMAGGILLYLLATRQTAVILSCLSGFPLGCLAAFIPICLWLIANGALYASFQASIIHNILYSGTTSEYTVSRVKELLYSEYGHVAIFFAAVSLIGAGITFRQQKKIGLPLAISLSAIGSLCAAFISHKYYDHYLMLGIPMAVMGSGFIFSVVSSRKKIITVVGLLPFVIWLCLQCHLANIRRLDSNKDLSQFFANAQSIADHIPPDERDSVYPYRVEPKWYVAAKILPCNRYYFLQETLADANPAIMDEIVSFFYNSPPQWIVIFNEHRPFSPPFDPRIDEIFNTLYQQVYAAGDYRLMRYISSEPE